MWELVCEGHGASRRDGSRHQTDRGIKAGPTRSSAAEGGRNYGLWRVSFINHAVIFQLENHREHTRRLCLSLQLNPQWSHFSHDCYGGHSGIFPVNAAMRKFIKRSNDCPGNGADTETNTGSNGYRHPKTGIFMAMFFLQIVCVFKIMLTGSNVSEGMDRWSCINR